MMELIFENIEHAFAHKSLKELKQSRFLFKVIFKSWVIALAKPLINMALFLHIPIKWAVKPTVYKYFCGGENIHEALNVVQKLSSFGVKTVLDFAAEETTSQQQAEKTFKQVMEIIQLASENKSIAFAVFKPSALCRVSILNKVSKNQILSTFEQKEYDTFVSYVDYLCQAAFKNNLPILIDAEYASMQNAIDQVLWEMMLKYNQQKAIVFNTLQMYRKDRLAYLKNLYKKASEHNIYIGVKFVRGAYLEQERLWAKEGNYPSPVHETKQATDNDFNEALAFCMEHLDVFSLFCGSHNEESCMLLVRRMNEKNVSKNDERIYFSQLYGMSDHISFNLAFEGYNVAKYVPFGPVNITIPYLLRRADENKSIGGQVNRELKLIEQTIKQKKK
ncbi:MAG: proline dehydrogenase [Bacteroidales bacterium]|nr:proline dehydrogenase [Bacteroidales bacterium]